MKAKASKNQPVSEAPKPSEKPTQIEQRMRDRVPRRRRQESDPYCEKCGRRTGSLVLQTFKMRNGISRQRICVAENCGHQFETFEEYPKYNGPTVATDPSQLPLIPS